jgi:hypothetical protein
VLHVNFEKAINFTTNCFRIGAADVHTEKWQSIDISNRPEAAMKELTNVTFEVAAPFRDGMKLDTYRNQIHPNLPWADRHFELERVSGQPINPGETWKEWPYANSADKFRNGELFSHTYAERYWPKRAHYDPSSYSDCDPMAGIRYAYGDLEDVVKLLAREPLTRQAYLPVWFPEDTGVVHGERVPCTLGYHFMMRDNRLNVSYFIRSCDFVRHFRDDLYLTVRLQLWILETLRKMDHTGKWDDVHPGNFFFWCGSLHCFVNDYRKMFPGYQGD